MTDRSVVALVACRGYREPLVEEAIARGFELLGGVGRFARAGERILLKPNLLVGRAPERAVTTHPTVFRAVARVLQAAGARLCYGDSPGLGRPSSAAHRAGIAAVAERLEIPLAEFSEGEDVPFPDGALIKRFVIARGALEADGIVSLPKLKTHGLMRMTGAIKNQFGCVPGARKAEFHVRLPDPDLFSQMLVDLNRLLRPRLFILDGILAMEGNGPQGGTPRAMDLLALSRDPVALDTVACEAIGVDPRLVPTIVHGERAGLGQAEPISIVGDPLSRFIVSDFAAHRRGAAPAPIGRISRLARRWILPRPVVRPERCTRCGTCAEVCPVRPKAIAFARGRADPPVYRYDRCIRCYCCQELCPEGAIEVAVPPLARRLHR